MLRFKCPNGDECAFHRADVIALEGMASAPDGPAVRVVTVHGPYIVEGAFDTVYRAVTPVPAEDYDGPQTPPGSARDAILTPRHRR